MKTNLAGFARFPHPLNSGESSYESLCFFPGGRQGFRALLRANNATRFDGRLPRLF